ncbi:MAG TPA: flagellar basal body P-ring formation protein FlgA [Deltaproteobacteria bacterium]|mgnify:CR=1 FL=1|nr:flagellar basal body P-ring formation protein FlgA [Deltaproteobacteria bacterium]
MNRARLPLSGYGACLICALVCLMVGISPLYASQITKIDGKTLKEIVTGHIKRNLTVPDEFLRIEFSSPLPEVEVSGGNVTWRVQQNRNEDFLGYTTVNVRFYNGNIFLKEENIRTKVEVLKDVVVASKFLPRNTIISYEDVKVVKRWCDRVYPNQISDVDDIIGKTVNARVKANYEIGRNMIRDSVAVKRGKLVRIVFNRGALSVSTIGSSEQDGDVGDLIRVKNLRSDKIVYARIEGDSLVRVDY